MQKPLLRKPFVFSAFSQVSAGESTRHGGVSAAPYHCLNLGKYTDDRTADVQENVRRFCACLGFLPQDLAWSRQVHEDRVLQVASAGGAEGYDALITQTKGILLAVSVADCTPILVFDPKNEAVAAIHAGWRGTVAGIVGTTLRRMEAAFGTRALDCFAYVGTCIDACSFEVGADVADAFPDEFKVFRADQGHFYVDLKKANTAQLRAFGVPDNQIEISRFSTVLHHADYFSHRLEKGVTGRMMAGIGVRMAGE